MNIASCLILAMLTAPGPGQDLCELMWGKDNSQFPPRFQTARDEAAQARFAQAHDTFLKTATRLSGQADEVFSAEDGRDKARDFLDKFAADDGTLTVRRDHFGLPARLLAWASYLACRSGKTDQGLLWLQMAWRDWGEAKTLDDAALLLLTGNEPQLAKRFVKDVPRTATENAIKGVFFCLTGKKKDALWLLEEAGRTAKAAGHKSIIETLAGQCRKGALAGAK